MSKEITTRDEFTEEVINANIPVIVDFWASWCAPCTMLSPVLDRIGDKYTSRAKVVKVDIEKLQAVAIEYNVRALPTVLFFVDGVVVEMHTGMNPQEVYEKTMDKILQRVSD